MVAMCPKVLVAVLVAVSHPGPCYANLQLPGRQKLVLLACATEVQVAPLNLLVHCASVRVAQITTSSATVVLS